ncbi:MAG: YqiA/YcfP family alpha/beta fold hydrolase [Myxococcota bacterium]
MNAERRYAYLHGFASSPLSRKGVALKEVFADHGLELRLPDLNRPSFSKLTFTGALEAVDEMDGGEGPPWCLVGSSMGGFVASRWAELHPDRVDRLVLLCPGFDMNTRWPAIVGAEAMARWRAHGSLSFPDGAGEPTPVHWGFIEDALTHPARPEVPCPTLILHGRHDETVPIESSRQYAATRPNVRLVELDDGHALTDSVDRIARETLAFFGTDR